MKVETKFVVGEVVNVLIGTKLTIKKIHSISIEINEKRAETKYWFKNQYDKFESALEENVFSSKESFLNQLIDEEDIDTRFSKLTQRKKMSNEGEPLD